MLLAALALAGVLPMTGMPLRAQESDPTGTPPLSSGEEAPVWEAIPGDGLTVLHAPGGQGTAARVAALLPGLGLALSTAFDEAPPTDLVVRLYPDADALLADDPLSIRQGDRVLRGHRTRDLVLIAAQGMDEALRYELAHHLLARRSEGRVPPLLAEGVASFLRRPREDQAAEIATLRSALERDTMPGWSGLMAPGAQFEEPGLHLAAIRAVVHYLVERAGLSALVDLAAEARGASGWRGAFERSFGVAPDRLEAAWLSWLPGYLDGGWRRHPLFPDDLSRVERLLAAGAYERAGRELEVLIAVDPDGALAERASMLMARAASGERTGSLLDEALDALAEGRFDETESTAQAAAEAAAAAGLPGAVAAARDVAARAQRGGEGVAQLERARSLPRWRTLQRRRAARQAYLKLAALGHGLAGAEAAGLARRADLDLAVLGLLPCAAGLALGVRNRRRRRTDPA